MVEGIYLINSGDFKYGLIWVFHRGGGGGVRGAIVMIVKLGGGTRTIIIIVVLWHFCEYVCESMLLWHTENLDMHIHYIYIYNIIYIFVECMQGIVYIRYMYPFGRKIDNTYSEIY